ncbi:MAG: DNA primase [Rickettsiales bacterium]|nr:DNA primase [Rickettsiales bacterium]
MNFASDFTQRLKDLISISSVISRKVKLQKHGKDFFGVCPFHREKTGSFSVNDEKKFYHCFGCGAHGDIFKFVQDTENVSFGEAVQILAKANNIAIPESNQENKKTSEVFEINTKALEFFRRSLFSSSGEKALNYLINRGITTHLIEEFCIGYAPSVAHKDSLVQQLLKLGYLEEHLNDAGLVKISAEGKVIDKFRDRIIFPIRNRFGAVIAFGGRAISAEVKPKYLNSPETEIFKKHSTLYLEDKLFKSRTLQEVFVVEGYTDAISMSKVGVPNVVATLGTAISDNHIKKLWQVVKEPTICMDGDVAGNKAAERAIYIVLPLLRPGYSINFVSLKSGYDPDDMITNFGVEQFKTLLQQKTSLSEMIWQVFLFKADLKTPEKQALLKSELYALIDNIEDLTVRDMYRKYFNKKIFELFSYNSRKVLQVNTDDNKVESMIKNKLSLLQRFEITMAALVIEQATILKDNLVLESFVSIEPTVPFLNNVYKDILEIFNERLEQEDSRFNDIFKEKIQLVVKPQLYNYLCGKQSYFVDKVVLNDYNHAVSLFNKTFELYKLELLKEDYIKSIKCLDEASLERAKLLREQLIAQEKLLKDM